jgi:hypothetical protein
MSDGGMMGDAQTQTINASMLTSVQNANHQPTKSQPVNSLTSNNYAWGKLSPTRVLGQVLGKRSLEVRLYKSEELLQVANYLYN